MSAVLFEVTGSDLALLDDDGFREVWAALGLIVRARYSRPVEPEPVAVAPVMEPDPPAPERVVVPKPPSAADRLAASRKRGAERAGFVKGGKPGTPPVSGRYAEHVCPKCGKVQRGGQGLAAHLRSHGVYHSAPVAVKPAPTNGTPERPDFAARAKAAADRTWRENHPESGGVEEMR